MDDIASHQTVDHGGDLRELLLGLFLVLRVPQPLNKGPCGLVVIVVPFPLSLVRADTPKG